MHNNLLLANPAGDDKLYVEDVFSSYLYRGTGAAQTITNGIDLAGKGGLVWIKSRSQSTQHCVLDSARGVAVGSAVLNTASTSPASDDTYNPIITSLASTGFNLGQGSGFAASNQSGQTYTSWTFRKAPKFFDVITYTGNSTARDISHSLGVSPGFIIIKRTDSTAQWNAWHKDLPANNIMFLNQTAATATTSGYISGVSATTFSIGTQNNVNASGGSYVAYLFAHDTTADGVIQCGSYTGNGSTIGPTINLGWEPQFLLVKSITETSANWLMFDNMRGLPVSGNGQQLLANSSGAEGGADRFSVTPTGFNPINGYSQSNASGQTYIYLAIRRGPMRTPTDAMKVFTPVARTGTGATATITAGFAPDAVIVSNRNRAATNYNPVYDKLRGNDALLSTNNTGAEQNLSGSITQYTNTGITVGSDAYGNINTSAGGTYINWILARAPGFFDVVCYTGTGSARTVSHNLGVAPELIIVKARNVGTATFGDWVVQSSYLTDGFAFPAGHVIRLNKTNASAQDGYIYNVSSSSFTVGGSVTSGSGTTYVAYLFASCPGVSKVGSYTGNGSSQNIDCGFTNGARFVLIKRTDSAGAWYVWDTARGIVAANDPHLSLNSTAAEVTTNDSIDPLSTGFTVNQNSATNINVSGGTYIYLAIA